MTLKPGGIYDRRVRTGLEDKDFSIQIREPFQCTTESDKPGKTKTLITGKSGATRKTTKLWLLENLRAATAKLTLMWIT